MSGNDSPKLCLTGLSTVELRQLEDALPSESIEEVAASPIGSAHGDPATIAAIVVVTLAAIKVVALILSQRVRGRRHHIKLEKWTRDGRVKLDLREAVYDAADPNPAFVKAIGDAFSVDVTTLLTGSSPDGKKNPDVSS